MTQYVALIRGINVGATRKLPMAELRAALTEAGFESVKTYIQSGNVVLSSSKPAAEVGKALEKLIHDRFKLDVPVAVRTAGEWSKYASGSPFPAIEAERPKMLHLCLTMKPPAADAVAKIEARALAHERVAMKHGELWIDFGQSVGTSKLTPAFLDKVAGSPLTARNWNTVLAVAALLEDA